MGLLLLDFTKYLKQINRIDFADAFGTSLYEQFQRIKDIYFSKDMRKSIEFEGFIKQLFNNSTLYMFLPRINKELKIIEKANYEIKILNNVAITIKSPACQYIFGNSYDFNLIGDCIIKPYGSCIEVKGFSIIASDEYTFNKLEVTGEPVLALETMGMHDTPNYHRSKTELEDTYLTEELCEYLIESFDYLANQNEAFESYDLWMKYLKFRKYYLAEQTAEEYEINHASIISGYSISRKEYKKNKNTYQDYLYDGNRELENGINVLLDRPVAGADQSIQLINIRLELNFPFMKGKDRESLEKEMNLAVRHIRHFSRQDLKLQNPANEKNFIPLGERYNIVVSKPFIDEEESNALIEVELFYNKSNFALNKKYEKNIGEINWLLKINPIAEKRKLERQEEALKNFFNGYLKNPNLITYLYNPTYINSNNYPLLWSSVFVTLLSKNLSQTVFHTV